MMRRWLSWSTAVLGAAILGVMAGPSSTSAADSQTESTELDPDSIIELTSGNSSFQTNIFEFDQDQAWLVDNVDYLFTDLYFLNFGRDPGQKELILRELDLISLTKPAENRLLADLSFSQANLRFSLDLTLYGSGNGSNASQREDIVTFYNTGNEAINVTLIQYLDFDLILDGSFDNDTLSFRDNTLVQTDASGTTATLTVDKTPTAVEFSEYPLLLSALYDDSRTTLKSTDDSLTNSDSTAALQFDHLLDPQSSVSFKFTKRIYQQETSAAVPEPMTLLALGVVGGGLLLLKKSTP